MAVAAVAAGLVLFGGRGASGQAGRSLTVDDVLRLEELDAVVPSPDGKYVAIEVGRPMSDVARVHTTTLDARPRTDIWIVRLRDGQRRQLTHGSATGSGWFDPVWSPDGARLAMMSTDGCSCVRVWTWTLGDAAPRLVDPRNVDYWVFGGAAGLASDLQPLAWLSGTTLLVPLLPAGERTHVDLVAEAESATIAGWRAQRLGQVSTASVLESIPGELQPYLSDESIVVADLERHTTRVLATIPRDPTTSGRRSIVLSPDHRTVAVLTSRLEVPRAGERLTRTMSRYALGLVDASGSDSVRWVGDFDGPGATGEDMPVPTWTPNGDALVLRGMWRADGRWETGLWRVDVRTGRVDLQACPAAMRRCSATQAAGDASAITVVADSGLYRLDAHTGHLADMLPQSLRRPTLRLHQLESVRDASGSSCIVATLRDAGRRTTVYRMDVTATPVSARFIGTLPPGYQLGKCIPGMRGLLVQRQDRAAAKLEAGRLVTLFDINAWSDAVVDPRELLVHYRGADGDSLGAIFLLPAAQRGKPDGPYPLVLWVYAEATYHDTAQVRADRVSDGPYNMALLTAHGYAVLYPSIPLWPAGGGGGDVAAHLMASVMPAIDRAGALGSIDTSRIAVMGQSFGGWTTLALITRTNRFRSAVALAVASDQVSYSGTFRAWDRPWSYAHTVLAPEKMLEAGQQRLGGTLWQYPDRYISNSPVFQADRVHTPTMIIQGDQDFQGIQQAEEFFNALYRLGKRAEFVRYVGDTHVIESPANVRDVWQRIITWLSVTLDNGDANAARHGSERP